MLWACIIIILFIIIIIIITIIIIIIIIIITIIRGSVCGKSNGDRTENVHSTFFTTTGWTADEYAC